MLDTKTRNDILLEEKIAKIDDINFDKIYDIDEFSTKQLESFEEVDNSSVELSNRKIADFDDEQEQNISSKNNTAFELELQPNEFLDNMVWGEDEEIEEVNVKRKFSLANKPLFFTFTSIAVLLCILFIYNVFVIKSLELTLNSSANSIPNNNINTSQPVEENNNIVFDNSNTIQIQDNINYKENVNYKNTMLQTNWFDKICTYLNQLFGGSY